MLAGATEFPQVGSYALLLSPAPPGSASASWGPEAQGDNQGPQLVRIHRVAPDGFAISLPLDDSASGFRQVASERLIDATPLNPAEQKLFCELSRELRRKCAAVGSGGRTKRPRIADRQKKQARYEALERRAIYAPLLAAKLKQLAAKRAAERKAA